MEIREKEILKVWKIIGGQRHRVRGSARERKREQRWIERGTWQRGKGYKRKEKENKREENIATERNIEGREVKRTRDKVRM